MPITNPLTKARARRKAFKAKQAEARAAKHDAARKVVLGGLQAHVASGGHLYAGTANPKKVAKRRAKNAVAKQSRKANR